MEELVFKTKEVLVVSDMDGTLLNDAKKIDEESLKAIIDLENKGLSFTLATSRPYGAIRKFARQLDVRVPLICSSGTILYDFQKNEVTKCELMDKKVLYKVLEAIDYKRVIVHTTENLYLSDENPRYTFFIKSNANIANKEDEFIPGAVKTKEEFYLLDNICQVSVGINSNDPSETLKVLNDLLKDEPVNIFYTGDKIIGIIKKDSSKANMAFYLAEYLGLEKENIIAFGDNQNDYEMLSQIKHSCAMANATEEIRKLAEKTTIDNNSGGVVHALKNIYKLI